MENTATQTALTPIEQFKERHPGTTAKAAITRPEPHTTNQESHLPDLPELKQNLIAARVLAADAEQAYGEVYKELVDALEATRKSWEMMNEEVVAQYEQSKTDLAEADAALRSSLIDYCVSNDTKKFDEQLSIRCTVKLDYDLDNATDWAKTNAPFILVADKKQFEGIAKKQELDFVTKVPTYTAVVASEL